MIYKKTLLKQYVNDIIYGDPVKMVQLLLAENEKMFLQITTGINQQLDNSKLRKLSNYHVVFIAILESALLKSVVKNNNSLSSEFKKRLLNCTAFMKSSLYRTKYYNFAYNFSLIALCALSFLMVLTAIMAIFFSGSVFLPVMLMAINLIFLGILSVSLYGASIEKTKRKEYSKRELSDDNILDKTNIERYSLFSMANEFKEITPFYKSEYVSLEDEGKRQSKTPIIQMLSLDELEGNSETVPSP